MPSRSSLLGFKRVERYAGRIIISDGEVFMAFWSNRRYPSLEAIHNAIDTGAINSGTDDEFSPGADTLEGEDGR